ncbi:MAG: helix-turn-helix domain-containing protein [Planctomycetota bacterium]|nr:helix-turn-helix domain-containing protein [Planctomycetota bacterium]
MSDSDRLTFDQACAELGLSEEQLEKLVADGEIASVKEGDTLFFKGDVIEAYQNREPAILLSDDEINLLEDDEDVDFGIELEEVGVGDSDKTEDLADPDETVVNLDGMLEDDLEGTTPMAGDDTGLLEDTDSGLGEDTLLDTDVLDLGEEDTDTFDLDTAEETLLDPTEEGTLLRGGGARVMQMKRKKSHAVWTALLAIGGFSLLVPLSVMVSVIYAAAGGNINPEDSWIKDYNILGDVVTKLAELFQ